MDGRPLALPRRGGGHWIGVAVLLVATTAGCARPHKVVVEMPNATSVALDGAAAGYSVDVVDSIASAGHPGATVLPPEQTAPVPPNGTVLHVVDGDTIDVVINGTKERVRLIGIDTPESKRPNTPIECFAREASAGTAALLPVGTPVRLERDVEERDRYGRLLAYVVRADDGLFVNLELARMGFAGLLTYPPNVAHTDEFIAAVEAARAASAGLWSRCLSPHEAPTS